MSESDIFIAVTANDRVVAESCEEIRPVLLGSEQELAGETPSLPIIRFRTVLDEAEALTVVLQKMSANRSRDAAASVNVAVDSQRLLFH